MATMIKKIESERAVESFTGVSSSHGIDIIYTPSNTYSLKIKAKAKLIEHIETIVHDGMLNITWKNEMVGFLKAKFMQQSAVVVHISAPTLSRIDLSTGTDFYAETIKSIGDLIVNIANGSGLEADCIKANNLTLTIKQASGIKVESVKSPMIVIENNTHSDVELREIEAESVFVNASGFSDTTLSGSIQSIAINAKGSSDTDIMDLKYNTINISNSNGSSVYK